MARLSNSRRGAAFILSAAALVFFLAAPSVLANVGNQPPHLARQHNRMIRKRVPQHGNDNGNGGADPFGPPSPSDVTSTTVSSTTTSQTSTTSDTTSGFTTALGDPFSTKSTTTTSSVSSTPSPISTTSTSLNLNTTTSSLAPNTTTTTTTTSSIPTSTSTTTTPPPPGSTSTFIVAASLSTTSNFPSQTGSPSSATSQSVAIARKTIVALVAIAGSVGLAFLVWTGIRRWKFRPSRGLDDRMQDPINWQPNAVGYDDSDPAFRIAAHRRNGSTGSHGSFGSSEMGQNNTVQPAGYGATGSIGVNRSLSGRSGVGQHPNEALPPLPPHDFTAGANGSDSYEFYHSQGQQHMPAVSSSPPQMVENGLTRGGSLTRPVSVRSENPYDGLDDDYSQQPALPPHHGGAYAAPAPPSYHTGL